MALGLRVVANHQLQKDFNSVTGVDTLVCTDYCVLATLRRGTRETVWKDLNF